MTTLRSLQLKEAPLFADTKLNLAQEGVTVIHGLNLNSGSGRSGNRVNTNFVGKSLLLSQIPGVFFREPLGIKAKDALKEGTRTVLLTNRGFDWRVVRKGNRPTIYRRAEGTREPWENVTPKELPARAAMLEYILGCNDLTFSVTQYLDNTKPNRLRTGDTAVRKQFFTDFFRLSATEVIGKKVRALKAENKRIKAALQELQIQEADYKEDNTEELVAKLPGLETKLRRIRKELQHADTRRTFDSWLDFNLPLLSNKVLRLNPEAMTLDAIKAARANVKRRMLRYQAQLDAFNTQEQYQDELREYKSAKRRILEYRDKYGLSEEAYAENTRLLAEEEQQEERIDYYYKSYRPTREELLRNIQIELMRAGPILDAERAKLRQLKHATTCHACGQSIPRADDHAEQVEKARKTVQAVKDAIEKLNGVREATERNLAERDAKAEKAKARNVARLKALRYQIALYENAPQLPDKPKRPEGLDDVGEDFDAVVTVRRYEKMRLLYRDVSRLLNSEVLEERLEQWQEFWGTDAADVDALQALEERAVKLQTRITEIRTRVAMNAEARARHEKLQARMKELESKLTPEVELGLLDEAFNGNKGIKQMVIQTICRKLERQVNHYAKMLYPEPYTFSFDLDSQFNILVTRRVGRREVTSDVRLLSGAESGMFSLVLALALRSFLPEHARSNVLVLDEVNANFSPEMTNLFIQALPALTKVVPHIIVITPRSTDDYGDEARYYTVVKKGSSSTLLPGRAETLKLNA